MNRLQIWAAAFGLTILAILGCYFFADRPFALFAHENFRPHREYFDLLTLIPEPFPVIAALGAVALGIRSLTGRAMTRAQAVALVWSLSALVATALNRQLKFAFGRTWPETWTNNNPSFINDGVYTFNPFSGGAGYAAFPSGHVVAICVTMTVLWLCYPKLRALYAALVALVVIGLIGANYHFLSDMIAGAFIGVSVGIFAVALWEAGGDRHLQPEKDRAAKTIRKKS